MKGFALVAHHYWNRPGGVQLVSAAAAASLDALGYRPVLASVARLRVEGYEKWFGIRLEGYPGIDLGLNLNSFDLYMRLLLPLAIRRGLRLYRPRLIFVDEPTYSPIVKEARRTGAAIIEYIHYPLELVARRELRGTGLYYLEDPYLAERYSRLHMRLYFRVYMLLSRLVTRSNPFEAADLVLANSRWTAGIVSRFYGREPLVLNPPLPPTTRIVEEPLPFEKRVDAIVMLGRFSEEKRYHWVIREVYPRVKREYRGARLYIMGSTGTKSSQRYYEYLRSLAESLGYRVSTSTRREADVYLVANAPRELINEVLSRAKLLLHATINEHWGIVVAEAMAAGTPVVVHRSGGAWTDLVEEGRRGLGYTNAEEAARAVLRLMTEPGLLEKLSWAGLEKARSLTLDSFRARLGMFLEKLGL